MAALAVAPGSALANDHHPDAPAAAKLLGISEREAAERLELQPHIGALRETAQRLFPGTFAGMWTNHDAGGVVTIAFTEGAQRNVAQLAQEFPRPLLLRPAGARRSAASLDRTLKALANDREAVRDGTLDLPGLSSSRFNVAVDEPRNRVVVTVERASSALRTALAARHGDGVVVEEGDVGEPKACYIHSCASSMRSGLRTEDGSGRWCSTAFTTAARDTFSAAHCTGGARYHQGYYFGYVSAQQQSGPVDAELIDVNQSGFVSRAWIMDDGQTATRPVTSMQQYSQAGVGQVVCKTGATTGRSCGTVNAVNTSVHWVPGSYNFVRATGMCARGGDSGAGIYINSQAVGILSGADSDENCSIAPNDVYFGHIHYAIGPLNAGVRQYENDPYFSSASAVAGESTVTVNFDLPVSCASVQTYDFTVEVAGAVPLTVTGDSCSLDSDRSFQLYLSTPVPPQELLEIALAGSVHDPAGNYATRTSHGIYP